MLHRSWHRITFVSLLLTVLPQLAQGSGCKLGKLASVPITMNGLRPTIEAQINGSPALFTLDSGAFWSTLSPAAAQQYQLRVDYTTFPGMYLEGVGGTARAGVTRVRNFTIFGVPAHNFDFIVGGSEPGRGTVGLLGQNILRLADIEYDLADGIMNLVKPQDCKHVDLAYWAKPGEPYSEMDIEATSPEQPHTAGRIKLNGATIRVLFDTGATSSVVGLHAAAAAGLKPGDPGVEPAGFSVGVGRKRIQNWIATFPVLKIGEEEIRNARLRIGDLGMFDMLLGDDFFLSHRVYVANSQHKLYFTYNGGPVFSLKPRQNAPVPEAGDKATPAGDTSANPSGSAPDLIATKVSSAPTESSSTPAENAADVARRAAASAARQDFDHALLDFNRAVALSPDTASYYLQRAMVERQLRQPEPAASDIEKAITLNPNYVEALLARAEYRRSRQDIPGTLADLDNVNRLLPKESDLHLTLAAVYGRADQFAQVIAQVNLWLPDHEQDSRVVVAYTERCRARALLGLELDQALRDCNAGLRINSQSPQLLDSRGLVNLRRNQFDKAIADYDEALKINPKMAWSLYGRGIAELHKGLAAKGQADVDAAKALAPRLPEFALRNGVSPP